MNIGDATSTDVTSNEGFRNATAFKAVYETVPLFATGYIERGHTDARIAHQPNLSAESRVPIFAGGAVRLAPAVLDAAHVFWHSQGSPDDAENDAFTAGARHLRRPPKGGHTSAQIGPR